MRPSRSLAYSVALVQYAVQYAVAAVSLRSTKLRLYDRGPWYYYEGTILLELQIDQGMDQGPNGGKKELSDGRVWHRARNHDLADGLLLIEKFIQSSSGQMLQTHSRSKRHVLRRQIRDLHRSAAEISSFSLPAAVSRGEIDFRLRATGTT
jgi:hypothetical protein